MNPLLFIEIVRKFQMPKDVHSFVKLFPELENVYFSTKSNFYGPTITVFLTSRRTIIATIYPNGENYILENRLSGVLNGRSTIWHENGNIHNEGDHGNGGFQGFWYWNYKNGVRRAEALFENKNRWKYIQYNSDGKKTEEGIYVDYWKKEGLWTFYRDDGETIDRTELH